MIYTLFILLIIILLVSYFFTKDIFSPPCMICESYVLAVYCAILNIDKWDISLSEKTLFIIFYGVLIFVLTYFACSLLSKYKKQKEKRVNDNNVENKTEKEYKEIEYNKTICLFLIIIQFCFVLSYLYFFSKSVGGFSLSNFSDLMSEYRFETSFEDSLQIPTILKQLHKFFKGFIYLFTYIELHNLVVAKFQKNKKRISLLFVISLILFFGQAILSSGRAELVIYFIFVLASYYLIYIHYFGNKSFNVKKIAKVCLVVLAALYCFSSIKTIFGRTSEEDAVDYVSRYFGGSIELFDLYLKNPAPKDDIWGKETFYNVNQSLAKLGLSQTYTIHLEFRRSNGVNLGNVYTAFRRMYHDFGLIGLTILQIVFSCVTFIYYKKVRESKDINKLYIGIVFYGIIAHTLLLHSFSEYFYSSIISINYALIILYMFIIKFLLTKIKIKVR